MPRYRDRGVQPSASAWRSARDRELARLVDEIREIYVASRTALDRPEAERLGVADAVLLELGATGATLLTTDFDLFGAARKAGYGAVNFNHLRDSRPGFRH